MHTVASGRGTRLLGFAILYSVPFVATALVAMRSLRATALHQVIGVAAFASICITLWVLAARPMRFGSTAERMRVLAGILLVSPFALVSLLWVGLSTPWEATPEENQLRYLVLLIGAVAVAMASVILKESLREAGEAIWSTLGFGGSILAGAAYLVWLSFQLGGWTARVNAPDSPSPAIWFDQGLDTLLFIACVLTYLATAAFAESFARTGWLGRIGGYAFVLLNMFAALCLLLRGVTFPDPNAASTPWFTRPGFIAGIPAVPWIIPHLMGAILLRRPGDPQH